MRQNFYAFGHLPYAWITQHPPTSAVVVWALLQDHRNAQGVCWPSLQRLEKLSGLSRSSLQRGVKWLTSHKYIEVDAGGGDHSSCYKIIWNATELPKEYTEKYTNLNGSGRLPDMTPGGINSDTGVVSNMTPKDNTTEDNVGAKAPPVHGARVPYETIREIYNEAQQKGLGVTHGLPGWKVCRSTKDVDRRMGLKRLWDVTGTEDKLKSFLEKACRNEHWRGGNSRGWRADIDFLCKPKQLRSIDEMDDSPVSAMEAQVRLGVAKLEERGSRWKITLTAQGIIDSFALLKSGGHSIPPRSSFDYIAQTIAEGLSGASDEDLLAATREFMNQADNSFWPRPGTLFKIWQDNV
tara:strand:- start:1830 stop:2882 length:1053 start_codon:yes stop_codon:yes gene_type:complete